MIYSRSSRKKSVARGEWMGERMGRGEAGEARAGMTRHGERMDFLISLMGNLWKILTMYYRIRNYR